MIFGWGKKHEAATPQSVEAEDYTDPDALIAYFKAETGVTFEQHRSIVIKKLASFCHQRKIPTFARALERLRNDEALRQELINHLTTNESFFFREFAQIEALADAVAARGGRVSVLCAPCATGEEPYSIAIALLERGVSGCAITGIDINTEALAKAREALYNERSVRNIPPELRAKYFTPEGERFRLNASVRQMVRFEQMNIFDPAFASLGRFDFVLSRNMLIYFDPPTRAKAQRILESMRRDPSVAVFYGHADLF